MNGVAPLLIEATEILENQDQFILVDTRPLEQYLKERIPGSLSINVYDFILESTSPKGIIKLQNYLQEAFAPLVPFCNKRVAFYEENTGMRSARALWFFNFVGGKGGSVLNGGLHSWKNAGGKTDSDEFYPIKKEGFFPINPCYNLLATYEDVIQSIGKRETVIIDSRSLEEYKGLAVDKCCDVKGRIPGAVHLNWEMLIDKSGKFLPRENIIQIAGEKGIFPNSDVIIYCHRGARSANTALALKWAGFQNIRNYIGSWHEWIRQPDSPII